MVNKVIPLHYCNYKLEFRDIYNIPIIVADEHSSSEYHVPKINQVIIITFVLDIITHN